MAEIDAEGIVVAVMVEVLLAVEEGVAAVVDDLELDLPSHVYWAHLYSWDQLGAIQAGYDAWKVRQIEEVHDDFFVQSDMAVLVFR